MKKHNIQADDLFTAVTSHLDEYQQPNNVRFKDKEYDFWGQQVAKAISDQLTNSTKKIDCIRRGSI